MMHALTCVAQHHDTLPPHHIHHHRREQGSGENSPALAMSSVKASSRGQRLRSSHKNAEGGPSRITKQQLTSQSPETSRRGRRSNKQQRDRAEDDFLGDVEYSDDEVSLPSAAQPPPQKQREKPLAFDEHNRLRELGSQEVPKQFPGFPVQRCQVPMFGEDGEDPFLQEETRQKKRTRGRKRISASTDIRNVNREDHVNESLADAKALQDWGMSRGISSSKLANLAVTERLYQMHARLSTRRFTSEAPRMPTEELAELREEARQSETEDAHRTHELRRTERETISDGEEADLSGPEEPSVAMLVFHSDGMSCGDAQQAATEMRRQGARALVQLPPAQIALRPVNDGFEDDDDADKDVIERIYQEVRAARKEAERKEREEIDRIAAEEAPEKERKRRAAEKRRKRKIENFAKAKRLAEDGAMDGAREELENALDEGNVHDQTQEEAHAGEEQGEVQEVVEDEGRVQNHAQADLEAGAVGSDDEEQAQRDAEVQAAVRGRERQRFRISEQMAKTIEQLPAQRNDGQQSAEANSTTAVYANNAAKKTIYTPKHDKPKRRNIYAVRQHVVGRTPWSNDEVECLMSALEYVNTVLCVGNAKTQQYAEVLKLHGPEGTLSNRLAARNNLQLKDKARNEMKRLKRLGLTIPPWCSALQQG